MNADSSSGGGHSAPRAATNSGGHALLDRPLRAEPIRPSGDAGDGWGRAAAYDAYADGLHTYAIWSLRDHDAAVDALYCAFVIADRNVRQLRQPEHIQPWLYAILRRECLARGTVSDDPAASGSAAVSAAVSVSALASTPGPVSGRLRPPSGAADPTGSLASLERSLRRAEFHSLEWPESEGLSPAHREILELTIRHGLDSHGLGLVLGLGQSADSAGSAAGSTAGSQGFGVLADAWRELERSLAAVAVAKASTEHCAQLAQLTFGWSGRLTGALRVPLTDHVDGCTRCQHYLHTVIGTPAAPTILPFIAAPRALREIVLGELRDPDVALRHGVDHDAIAAHIRDYTPDGFPVAWEAPARRRGARRAAPKRVIVCEPRRDAISAATATATAAPTATATPAPTPAPTPARTAAAAAPAAQARHAVDETDLTLCQHSALPAPTAPLEPRDALPHRLSGTEARERNRPRIERQQPTDVARSSHGTEPPGVYRTPGSWAARVLPQDFDARWPATCDDPLPPLRPGVHGGESDACTRDRSRFPATALAAETPRARDYKPRAQHRSRPMRKAMISAVTLGAAGAAAAATAALLGLVSEGHATTIVDAMPSQDPAGPSGGSSLTVTVSTPPAPLASSGTHSSRSHDPHKKGAAGSAAGGAVSSAAGTAPGSGSGGNGGTNANANAADFHVSVNQRAGDPNSVTIVLRNSGSTPIAWQAAVQDSWITLSQSSGVLNGGQSLAITATATSAAPAGQWTSTVTFAPGGAVVVLHGGYANPSTAPTSPAPGGSSTATTPGSTSTGTSTSATPQSSAASTSARGGGASATPGSATGSPRPSAPARTSAR